MSDENRKKYFSSLHFVVVNPISSEFTIFVLILVFILLTTLNSTYSDCKVNSFATKGKIGMIERFPV